MEDLKTENRLDQNQFSGKFTEKGRGGELIPNPYCFSEIYKHGVKASTPELSELPRRVK